MCKEKFLIVITLENKIIAMENATSTRKRDTLQKTSKRHLVVTNKHQKIRRYSTLQNFQEMK